MEILVVIDKKLRNIGPSVEIILKELKDRFQEEMGNDVHLKITEVDEVEKDIRRGTTKVVISKIKKEKFLT